MELVYLWVDKYKNIDKQGFDFSPRFRCEYDEEKNELTINENKDYISIFPDNINITAIVGENGSGKSSIIEEILSQNSGHIIVYKDGNEFYVTTSKKIKHNYQTGRKLIISKKVIYLNSDILKSANIINTKSMMNSCSHKSNLYITDCISGSNSEILNLNKFHQNIYKKIFQIFKEKINLKFDFTPTRVILSFKEKDIKEYSEDKKIFFKKLKDNHKNGGSIKKIGYEIKDFITNYFDDNKDIFFELLKNEAIGVMLYDELERNIFHLSNGERKQFIDMILVYEKLKERNTNCLILLDEPDLGIHPDWQKKYITKLINTFSNFGKKLHFIITSHSPFILSDLPKENVIFLENGKQVYPFEDGKQTFGANIHTLLSHGFFMKDGLIGEFAKNKISKILNFLNGKNKFIDTPINQIKPTIELIGEDFLKEKLLKMYDEKFKIKSKDDEIKELKAEIERLKNAQNKI
ncbi:AAA family ATPase [Aliarcobacter cryaerophilus]|uniref:AAA family ATPase n=1 Tax=Aliarcobacter cryaerophilus TaxID=28198 RepID=UPI000824E3FE|nr:AAA family ATPase [Aliarcobacter cryaerophilus]